MQVQFGEVDLLLDAVKWGLYSHSCALTTFNCWLHLTCKMGDVDKRSWAEQACCSMLSMGLAFTLLHSQLLVA